MANTTAYQRLIFKVQNSRGSYVDPESTFLSEYFNSISWPSHFKLQSGFAVQTRWTSDKRMLKLWKFLHSPFKQYPTVEWMARKSRQLANRCGETHRWLAKRNFVYMHSTMYTNFENLQPHCWRQLRTLLLLFLISLILYKCTYPVVFYLQLYNGHTF